MTTHVKAVYENGVFRPTQPVRLAEGTKVDVVILQPDAPSPRPSVAEQLGEIARLPPEGPDDGFSGADHDEILYPDGKSR
jgi:predicted DNA-binding antitoxin AbrB/MazE fold protein